MKIRWDRLKWVGLFMGWVAVSIIIGPFIFLPFFVESAPRLSGVAFVALVLGALYWLGRGLVEFVRWLFQPKE